MRWKSPSSYREGNTRVKKKFLLFPRCINGEYRWLENARYKQMYKKLYDIDRYYFTWVDTDWLD